MNTHTTTTHEIMTQIPAPLTTPAAPPVEPASIFASTPVPTVNGAPSTPLLQEEDEPYTIKCICGFQDDDGNTVFCEKCETWQHIECYYFGKKVPDVHNCSDCEPRPLDAKRATERQRRRREGLDVGAVKPKRPPAKSHKKKSKDSGQQINGWPHHEKTEGGPDGNRPTGIVGDVPPAKRSKTNHRPSSSISSQVDSRHPSAAAEHQKRSGSMPHNGHGSTGSPSGTTPTTNGHHKELYSLEFMRLHREDPGDSELQANLLSNINFTSTFASWLQSIEALRQATNGKSPADVFQRVDVPFEEMQMPEISKEMMHDYNVECFGQHLIWQYLVVKSLVPAGGLVGEVKGEIGPIQEYAQDPANRPSLRHPEPFVFFHPHLPIYIDTRREGTRLRYVRRSCRPNAEMKTLISDGLQYHFCLLAIDDLEPGDEITIGWNPDPAMLTLLERGLSGKGPYRSGLEPLSRAEFEEMSSWCENVLANFGGCACNSPGDCLLTRFDRRRNGTSLDASHRLSNGTKPPRSKKVKPPPSPQGTGHAANSRAGSEGSGNRDHADDMDDSRSTSGSVRSKPRSRDMTPLTHFSGDGAPVATGDEMSDREKRKLAALERTFEALEQDGGQHGQRKKKRTSGGSSLSTSGATNSVRISCNSSSSPIASTNANPQKQTTSASSSQPTTPNPQHRPSYLDAATSLMSRSPTGMGSHDTISPTKGLAHMTLASPSPKLPSTSKAQYHDSWAQTEGDGVSWYHDTKVTPTRKTFMPLTKRLLRRCHEDKVLQDQRRSLTPSNNRDPVDGSSQSDPPPPNNAERDPLRQSSKADQDVEMTDSGPHSERADPAAIRPIDSNVQKPRPPDVLSPESSHEPATNPPFKPLPPSWSSSSLPAPPDHHPVMNGHRNPNLQVQLPGPANSNPSSSASVPGTPSSSGTVTAKSPFAPPNISTSMSPSVVQNVVQASPVKKKLSLSDYSRRKKAETPTVEKTAGAVSSLMYSTSAHTSSIAEEGGAKPADGGKLVASPTKDSAGPAAIPAPADLSAA